MASRPPPQPTYRIGSDLGAFRLNALIAAGGMAEVYLAAARGAAGFEKQLALKVILPELAEDETFIQMLVNEAKLAMRLRHANIVQTFDLGKIGSVYFISMEYVDGCDLYRFFKKLTNLHRPMPVEAALYIVREMMMGLDYAHQRTDESGAPLRLVHRDISPQNVLLSRRGEVKITDFGIAKAANVSNKTRAGVIKGKLVYMSPEQSWGDPVDQRTDIFSAGIVLYEALAGKPIYRERNPIKLLELVRKADVPSISKLRADASAEVDKILHRAVESRPTDRYQSAKEMARAIDDYLKQHSPNYGAKDLAALINETLGPTEAYPVEFATGDQSLRSANNATANTGTNLSAQLMLLSESAPQTCHVGDLYSLGRIGDMKLVDTRVSRRHAQVVRRDGHYEIEDLGSANGTYLNGARINGAVTLRTGDMIRIGPFEMRFVLQAESAAFTSPRPTNSAATAAATPAGVSPKAIPPAADQFEERDATNAVDEEALEEALPDDLDVRAIQNEFSANETKKARELPVKPITRPIKIAAEPEEDATSHVEQLLSLCIEINGMRWCCPLKPDVPIQCTVWVGHTAVNIIDARVEKRDASLWLCPTAKENKSPPTRLVAGHKIQLGPWIAIVSPQRPT